MSETVERVARALFVELGWEGVGAHPAFEHDQELWCKAARAALESLRTPDPHVIARAADRLGIPPTEAAKLAGMWIVIVEEMLRLDSPSQITPHEAGS